MTFLPESCMKKWKWWSAICNYKQPYKSLCVSSTKLRQTMKGSLCYSESIYVEFRLNKSILQELWIFFACMYTKKTCLQLQWLMSLTSHTSTVIAMRPKIFALLYWMDWCILQAYLWKYLNIMELFIRDKQARQNSMPIGNSQLSKTGYESYLLHYTVISIEEKVFTFKHGLNKGWSIYRLLIIRLQVQWINGNPCYKRC